MFGEFVMQKGHITQQQLDTVLQVSRFRKAKIGRLLVELGFISKQQLDSLLIDYLQPFNQDKYQDLKTILSLPQNQGRPGFLVMEEFAMLGRNNPAFRDFAIDFAEIMRKRGCWLITLTPRPQSYFDLEVGKAFWGVADNFVFLQMSSDNVDYIAEKSSLLDEASREIIRSLRTKKGQYAEVFYMNKSKTRQGAFRFRQTAYDRWMSPTNALDAMEAIKALEKYPNKWEALEYLVGKESTTTTSEKG